MFLKQLFMLLIFSCLLLYLKVMFVVRGVYLQLMIFLFRVMGFLVFMSFLIILVFFGRFVNLRMVIRVLMFISEIGFWSFLQVRGFIILLLLKYIVQNQCIQFWIIFGFFVQKEQNFFFFLFLGRVLKKRVQLMLLIIQFVMSQGVLLFLVRIMLLFLSQFGILFLKLFMIMKIMFLWFFILFWRSFRNLKGVFIRILCFVVFMMCLVFLSVLLKFCIV